MSATLQPGARVGGYVIEAPLRPMPGGFVYRALQENLDRTVALAVVDPAVTPGFSERAGTLASLEHPHLVPIYDVGTHDGRAYAAMRLVTAPTAAELGASGVHDRAGAVAVGEQLAGALEELQRAGLSTGATSEAVRLEGPIARPHALLAALEAPDGDGPSGVAEVVSTLGGGPRVSSHVGQTPSEVALAARVALAPKRRRIRVPIVAALVLAAVGVLALLLLDRDSEHPTRPVVPARITAVVPLGERPTGVAVGDRAVWVTTEKRHLLRVDSGTMRVTGSPLTFPGAAGSTLRVVTGDHAAFVVDTGAASVSRVDERTGKVTARTRMPAQLTDGVVRDHTLWLLRASARKRQMPADRLYRLDTRTLRPSLPALMTEPAPEALTVGDNAAFTSGLNSGTVVRLPTRGGRPRAVNVAAQAADTALAGGRLWIADPAGRVVIGLDSALDRPADVVLPLGPARDVTVADDALWVVAGAGVEDSTPEKLWRIDPRAGRPAGRPMDLGGDVTPPASDGRTLWLGAPSRQALLRVDPGPIPALRPVPADDGLLRSGPSRAGRRAVSSAGLRVSLDPGGAVWTVTVTPDVVDVRDFRDDRVGLAVMAPKLAIKTGGRGAQAVTSTDDLLVAIRANRDLTLGPVKNVQVGGRSARQFVASVRPGTPTSPVCGVVCVPVYARGAVTMSIPGSGKGRVTIFDLHGHSVAVEEDTGSDERSLVRTQRVLRSLRVAP